MLLNEFVERFWSLTPRDYFKPSTRANYASIIANHILPYLGDREVGDITVMDIQKHIVTLQNKGLSPKTVRNTVMCLRVLWKRAIAWKIAKGDCFFGLMLPRVTSSERTTFTLADITRIVQASPIPYNVFFWLAAETGLRAGELCALRVCDIDDTQNYVSVRQSLWSGRVQLPKTKNSIRTCAISSALASALRVHILSDEKRGTGDSGNGMRFVFTTVRGNPWNPSAIIKRVLHPTLGSLGLPLAGLHSFRHSSASLADSASLPLKVRQQRLGHADARVTLDTYTHVGERTDAERAFVNTLGNTISSGANVVTNTQTHTSHKGDRR
jgi:integrase